MMLGDWEAAFENSMGVPLGPPQAAVMRYRASDALIEWFYAFAEGNASYTLTQYQRLLRRRTALRLHGAGMPEAVVIRALQLAGEPADDLSSLDALTVDSHPTSEEETVLAVNDVLPALCVPTTDDPFVNLIYAPRELRYALLWRPRLEDILVFRSPNLEYRYLVEDSLPFQTSGAIGSWSLAGLEDHQRGVVPAWVLPPGVESFGEFHGR